MRGLNSNWLFSNKNDIFKFFFVISFIFCRYFFRIWWIFLQMGVCLSYIFKFTYRFDIFYLDSVFVFLFLTLVSLSKLLKHIFLKISSFYKLFYYLLRYSLLHNFARLIFFNFFLFFLYTNYILACSLQFICFMFL